MANLVPYYQHRRTLLHVDLKAPPSERWLEAGQKIGEELQEAVQEVVVMTADNLHKWAANWSPAFSWTVKQLVHPGVFLGSRLIHVVAGLFGQEYQHEISGLATAANVPYTHLLLANLMYDITLIGEHLYPQACSSFSCSLRGKPVLVRNMDWDRPESIGRHTVMVEFHKGNKSYKSVGIAGMVGVLSAMYPGKWAVTLNQAPTGVVGIRYSQTPALQRLRHACDGFGSFRSLVTRLQELQTMSPFFAHVVGTEAHEQVVINGFGSTFSERTSEDEQFLLQTNHFVGDDSEGYNPENLLGDWDTGERYSAIHRRLKRRPPSSLLAAWKVMEKWPVTHDATMQSMAICPATDKLLLKVRV